MLTRVIDNPRVANAVAFVALFIALGGLGTGAYAAVTLHANSVGSAQIKTGAVHSAEIYDHGILLRDINPSARKALHGQTGPAGPAGPAGASAVKHFAAVSPAGAFLLGDAKAGGREQGIGTYTVGFADSVASCVPVATLGTTDATTVPPGRITVSKSGDRVAVQTYDAAGNPADLPFQLVVAC
jgi:hypothetical protein